MGNIDNKLVNWSRNIEHIMSKNIDISQTVYGKYSICKHETRQIKQKHWAHPVNKNYNH